jgi:hypothetical protein
VENAEKRCLKTHASVPIAGHSFQVLEGEISRLAIEGRAGLTLKTATTGPPSEDKNQKDREGCMRCTCGNFLEMMLDYKLVGDVVLCSCGKKNVISRLIVAGDIEKEREKNQKEFEIARAFFEENTERKTKEALAA